MLKASSAATPPLLQAPWLTLNKVKKVDLYFGRKLRGVKKNEESIFRKKLRKRTEHEEPRTEMSDLMDIDHVEEIFIKHKMSRKSRCDKNQPINPKVIIKMIQNKAF